jgi:hypothetical protein
LIGRIDRIDVNDRGEHLILDYKTSEAGAEPSRSHRQLNGTWIDLQLPLYRHLVPHLVLGKSDVVQLGYFNLAKSASNSGIRLADWTDDDLTSADECARGVVRRIRKGEFGPPAKFPSSQWDPWSWICMAHLRA